MSRTKNTLRNIGAGFFNKIITLLFPFVIRTIIINKLGSQYLGLGSLFSSILQVLNLTELGFNSAIVFNMYKSIANKDDKTICALLNFYKKVYRIIGTIIFVLGLLILVFIPNLINGSYPSDINIYILYLIYLFNTVITYFLFAYKGALITAYQRNDIISNIQTIVSVIQYVLQIIVLVIFKNFYYYIIIQTFSNILNNLLIEFMSKKYYPQYVCHGVLSKNDKIVLKKNIYGLMIQKICASTRNSLDSIFISMFMGLNTVAIYNNYYSIIAAVISFLSIFSSAMVASIGNSVATESIEKNYSNLNNFNFIYMWISGWSTICLLCLYQPFMKIWMGDNYMFPFGVVICFCLYFYQLKTGDIISLFKETAGTWYVGRYQLILETIVNIILNYILGKYFGVYGIILATFCSLLFVGFTYGTYIIFHYYLKGVSIKKYYFRHFIYFITTVFISIFTYFICSLVHFSGMTGFLIKIIICLIIPNLLYFIVYYKTNMFKESEQLIKNVINIILKKLFRYNYNQSKKSLKGV